MAHKPRSSRIFWVAAIASLAVALTAYRGNVQGWLGDDHALILALLGVLGFALLTLISAFLGRSRNK